MAQPLNIEAFIWATAAFCQLSRIPHDAALLIKQYPPPYDIVHLQQALHHFGLNNSRKRYNLNQLPQASMPCLAILNPIQQSRADSNNTVAPVLNATQLNSSTTSDTDSNADSLEQSNNPPLTSPSDAPANQNYDIAMILSRDDQRLLVLYPNQAEPVTVSIDDQDFNARITGDFLMVRKAEEALTDEDGVTQGNAGNNVMTGNRGDNVLSDMLHHNYEVKPIISDRFAIVRDRVQFARITWNAHEVNGMNDESWRLMA